MTLRKPRGFTLVEAAVVLGVLGTLVLVGYNALSKSRSQQGLAAATGQLSVAVRRVRAEAFATGSATVLVVDAASGRYWGIEDVGGAFDFSTFDPDKPAPSPLRLILSERLPAQVAFGPEDGHGDVLPAPFAAIPANSACTFCDSGTGLGYVAFAPGSAVRSASGPLPGASLTLSGENAARPPTTVVINGRTGAVSAFERPE